jgi:hypothetical protein
MAGRAVLSNAAGASFADIKSDALAAPPAPHRVVAHFGVPGGSVHRVR